jgi:hypothetical protein
MVESSDDKKKLFIQLTYIPAKKAFALRIVNDVWELEPEKVQTVLDYLTKVMRSYRNAECKKKWYHFGRG